MIQLGAAAPAGHLGFFRLGVEHILAGYDHLLFLAALLLGGGGWLALLKIVTAFTLAHSLTLALVGFGLVNVSARLIEPLIAASIVWVAIENVARREGRRHDGWSASPSASSMGSASRRPCSHSPCPPGPWRGRCLVSTWASRPVRHS